ncbi:MAG: Gfo/Idh/MocA family oxidoreductase, partial [Bacteroidetes bacterium]|nr:Gfo/Idh/MocA family oxidoreductase [Bacteroidota bacterium]
MSESNNISRRNILKAFAAVPILGAFGYGVFRKKNYDNDIRDQLVKELGLSYDPPVLPTIKGVDSSKPIRIGIIGYGIRGEQLMRAAGFAHPTTIDEWRLASEKDSKDHRLEDFLAQENLNLQITGACDLFDLRARGAAEAGSNINRKGSQEQGSVSCKIYKNYKDLIAASDIDAVIIATPDHWHTKIAIDAALAGKHVYVEKGMTRTVEEVFELTDVIKKTGIVFQLGHQGRQTESFIKAKEIIDKGLLGKISLIEVCTNRNSPNGAWVYDIHPDASEQTIDWEQFQEPAPNKVPFSKERFFRWRCWWDYGTGLGGDLLTHEYDALNQILNLGIPHSCVASGGVYFYKDGREVPDVFQAVYEYPDRDFTFMYSATLSSDRDRGKIIMGHDGNMSIGGELTVYADPESTRYKPLIDKGVIDPSVPIFLYSPGSKRIDAVTSATAKYFAGRGLLYTYRQGKRVDTTHLHIKEWTDCIRTNQQPSCNIDQGYQEAITAHMATISYLDGVKVYWDKEKQAIVKG